MNPTTQPPTTSTLPSVLASPVVLDQGVDYEEEELWERIVVDPSQRLIVLNNLNPYPGAPMVQEAVPEGVDIFNLMSLRVSLYCLLFEIFICVTEMRNCEMGKYGS